MSTSRNLCSPAGHKGKIPFVVVSFGYIVPIWQFDQVRKVCFEPIVVEHCLHNSEKVLVSNLFSIIKRAQVRATDEPEIVLKVYTELQVFTY